MYRTIILLAFSILISPITVVAQVTSVGTGTGLTGGPITTTGTISLSNPTSSTIGGIKSITVTPHQYLTGISTSGIPSAAQPACTDLSNSGTACQASTGTSGHALGFLDGNNTYTGSFTSSGAISGPAAGVLENSKPVFAAVHVQSFMGGHGTYTYTPTTGMVYATIECVGPGGSGGGVSTVNSVVSAGAAGGSAGGYSRVTVTAAQVGSSLTVTLGTGGAAPTAGANNGNAGTTATSVGTLCVANAGKGGGASDETSTTTSYAGVGGIPASAGTGDVALAGQPGSSGTIGGNQFFPVSGAGASVAGFGQGGGNVVSSYSSLAMNGLSGGNCGGGGSGGVIYTVTGGAVSGGAGGDGCVLITEYVDQ